MPEFANAAIDDMLDWYTGVANPPSISDRFITIFDGDPNSGGSEVLNTIAGSATRPNMTTAMGTASGGSIASDTNIQFTASAVGAADVDWVAVYSAATAGTLLGATSVTLKNVGIGDSLSIPIGDLTFAIT